MAPGLRIWITRAEPGATRTAQRLIALGHRPLIAPLLEIRVLPDVPVPELSRFAALAFTSPNGVEAFARLTQDARHLPCYCVGDTTRDAALAAGFRHACSADGDIHDLARLIRDGGSRGPLLAPGAREPAGDLPALLPGLQVQRLPVYAAVETGISAPADFDLVMVHSPRAARALTQALSLARARQVAALTISPAAAAPLNSLGLKEIYVSSRPDETSMISALGKRAGAV
ncbi:uroporphyrinogen-III synthase [Brevundimonas vesicularis]|uniref:uroporphyrinogen-III synthase n=1 Tax=Brevundimonas vesicularis TaxID=41276 RepID=UPI0038D36844